MPAPNNRVVLQYQSSERRCERMSGGVPAWTWLELGPMVRDLDAIYLNFISGFELTLGTAQALRQGFDGPIYADLHSLFLGMQHDGIRVLQPLPSAAEWLGCFDVVQLNEDEMHQLSPDPLSLSADALAAGVSLLVVTLGPRGAAYVAAPGFDGLGRGRTGRRAAGQAAIQHPPDRPTARPPDRLTALSPSFRPRRSTPSIPPVAATSSAPRRARGCSRAIRSRTRSATPRCWRRGTRAFAAPAD